MVESRGSARFKLLVKPYIRRWKEYETVKEKAEEALCRDLNAAETKFLSTALAELGPSTANRLAVVTRDAENFFAAIISSVLAVIAMFFLAKLHVSKIAQIDADGKADRIPSRLVVSQRLVSEQSLVADRQGKQKLVRFYRRAASKAAHRFSRFALKLSFRSCIHNQLLVH